MKHQWWCAGKEPCACTEQWKKEQMSDQPKPTQDEQIRAHLAIEIGLIRSVLATLISWIAQSSMGVISTHEAKELLEKLDSINTA